MPLFENVVQLVAVVDSRIANHRSLYDLQIDEFAITNPVPKDLRVLKI
jgi:hypothetical protein